MKQLELTLNKRLLIVEYETEAELAIDFALMKAFNNPKIMKFGLILKPICKGPDLTEEIAKGLIQEDRTYINSIGKKLFINFQLPIDGKMYFESALESFISAIEAKNMFWGIHPNSNLPELNVSDFGKWYIEKSTKEYESRTFNIENVTIFEIL